MSIENFSFIPASTDYIQKFVNKRTGETKIGEKIQIGEINSYTKFLLLGIEESMGPQSNGGLKGAEKGFQAFLKRFLNMQSNRFLKGEEICFIGTIIQNIDFQNESEGRKSVEELDLLVESTLSPFIKENIIPIVIGGGHNNAYPLIKSLSKNLGQKINVINLDPHADCRALEGRHSGNPFSYANTDGFLNDYAVLGLHQAYNSEFILDYLDSNNFNYTFFDDYLINVENIFIDLKRIIDQFSPLNKLGIELDLDSLRFMPSSAFTPSGISVEQARKYIKIITLESTVGYLHLPEGAPANENEEKIVGKTLAYLVWDFISTISSK